MFAYLQSLHSLRLPGPGPVSPMFQCDGYTLLQGYEQEYCFKQTVVLESAFSLQKQLEPSEKIS